MKLLTMFLGLALWALPAAAQIPGRERPGPFVIDVRGSTSGLPTDAPFYPAADGTVAISSRGFGFEGGGHVYFADFGAARLGIGASFTFIRGTSPDASATVRLLAPQVSFNFGSSSGWSYLSAGIGTGEVETELRGALTGSAASGSLRSVNAGGGARWFVTRHAAVGFDVRVHRLAAGEPRGGTATPQTTLLTASIGVSLK